MQETTLTLIQKILEGDNSVCDQQMNLILRACKTAMPKRRVIQAKEAMQILNCSRPTLRRFVHQKILTQINISSRKIRFDLDEVERLATEGATYFKEEMEK